MKILCPRKSYGKMYGKEPQYNVICYRRYEISDRLDRIFNHCRNFMIQMKEIVSNFDDDHASFSLAKFNWRITATFINITLPISTLRITFINSTLDFGNESHFADICINEMANGGKFPLGHSDFSTKTGSTKPKAPPCIVCERQVAKTQKRLACEVCREFTHARCLNSNIDLKFFSISTPTTWTCPCCAFTALPFRHADFSDSAITDSDVPGKDAIDSLQFANEHLSALQERSNQLKVLHINTQSMVSTFDELLVTMNEYPFDVVTMRETWLKDNPHLLSYVNIPGYCSIFGIATESAGEVLALTYEKG